MVPQDFMVLDLQEEKLVEVVEVMVVLHPHLLVKLKIQHLLELQELVVQVQILVQLIQVYQTQEF
tara:strand:- start:209 stop:403 length:195 start_codon:yes stop_codon:yes gene_type:complete